jgi:hypothetical protein
MLVVTIYVWGTLTTYPPSVLSRPECVLVEGNRRAQAQEVDVREQK